MGLNDLLKQENPCLYQHVVNIRTAAEPLLERQKLYTFTDHSLKHSERVIEALDGLTCELMKSQERRLSSVEMYMLLAAAYLHDIGMLDERTLPSVVNGTQAGDKEASKWLREHHHELTRDMILQHVHEQEGYIELGLPRITGVDDKIALIAEAHRKVDLHQNVFDNFSVRIERAVATKFRINSTLGSHPTTLHETQTLDENVRPRLLAALLRFADELDIDRRRVYMDRLKLMQPGDYSSLCWYLCNYVEKVVIENEIITIHYQFPSEHTEYERLIRPLVEHEIELKRKSLQDTFWPNGVKPTLASQPSISYTKNAELLPANVKKTAEIELDKLNQVESYKRVELPDISSISSNLFDSETIDAA